MTLYKTGVISLLFGAFAIFTNLQVKGNIYVPWIFYTAIVIGLVIIASMYIYAFVDLFKHSDKESRFDDILKMVQSIFVMSITYVIAWIDIPFPMLLILVSTVVECFIVRNKYGYIDWSKF